MKYKEEKLLTVITYEIETKAKNIYTILIGRKNSSDSFYFLNGSPNKQQIEIGKKTKLILKIGIQDKEKTRINTSNLYFSLNKKTGKEKVFNKENIDLKEYYSYLVEVKFKDLNK